MDKKITLTALTFPIFIENFLRMFLGNVNVFMISQFSDKAVGAVGVANQVISMVIMLYGIISYGTAVIINQYLGSGNREKASQVAAVAIVSNFVFSSLLSLGLVIFAELILKIMNLPKELMEYGRVYLMIAGGATFTQALIATMSGISRCFGHPKYSMLVAIEMNILNIIGNYLVVFQPFGIPAFGVAGISTSLVISEIIAVITMFYLLRYKINIRLKLGDLIPFPKEVLRNIVKIGIPSAGEFLSYNGSQIVTTSIIAMLGSYALTTRVYTQNLMYLVWMLGLSIGQGTMILVGHMVGSNRMNAAYKNGLHSLKIAMIVDSTSAFCMFLISRPALGVFTNDQTIINLGSILLLITIVLEPGRAFNLVIGNALRGAGDVRYPVIMGVLSMWLISVPLCYILGIVLKMGLPGIWLAFATDEWTRGIIMMMRWKSRTWQGMSIVKDKYMEPVEG